MIERDCENIYSEIVNTTTGSGEALFSLAQCFMSGYDINKLRAMLSSEHDGVILDGLFVCKEIGRLVCQVNDQIEPLRGHHDYDIRKMATEVAGICKLYRES